MKAFDLFARALGKREAGPPPQNGSDGEELRPAELFDKASRILASSLPRREAIKLAALAAAAGALTSVGVKPAWAGFFCVCGGIPMRGFEQCCQFGSWQRKGRGKKKRKIWVERSQVYNVLFECCTPTGVQLKHPVQKLAKCPNFVPHPGHHPSSHGQGPTHEAAFIPDHFARRADWHFCKECHDICYDTCGSNQAFCDRKLKKCLIAECLTKTHGMTQTACLSAAATYFPPVLVVGALYHQNQQAFACDCCPGDSPCCTPEQVCGFQGLCCGPNEVCENGECVTGGDHGGICTSGGTCGTGFPTCPNDTGCVCFNTTEGNFWCVDGGTLCSSIPVCVDSEDCPVNHECIVDSCCGQPVCGPLCGELPDDKSGSGSGPTLTSR